jgi:hypothetical protein
MLLIRLFFESKILILVLADDYVEILWKKSSCPYEEGFPANRCEKYLLIPTAPRIRIQELNNLSTQQR